MRKIAYILSFVMLPLVAMAGDIKYTRPVLTLKNDTLIVEFSMSVEDVRVNSEQTYAFTPVLREGKNYYAMPPVVVTGKNGDYKMRRQERKMARRFGFDNPFCCDSRTSGKSGGCGSLSGFCSLSGMDGPCFHDSVAGRKRML